ncbi:MAG TPA: GGDEF domain-containing protein [Allosphingosinicella sp.]|nr:GGDEF domain-containing protein [Allosphingosinicella sp.]
MTHEAWFGPVYLLLIGFAGWTLGWREAFGVGMACMAITVSVNGLTLYPYGTASALWNLAMRFGVVTLAIGLMETVRRSYSMQWRMARIDPLTGALNRQAFFESLDMAQSRGWSMLVYLDLDGFKTLNDEQGHAAGDESLRAFAKSVRKLIRKRDIFARIGGDEFVIYMNVRDETAARQVAMRLHLAMNSTSAEPGWRLPCSLGVLVVPAGPRDLDAELRLADQLMYDAKQQGASVAIATAEFRDGALALVRNSELTVSASTGDAVRLRPAGPDHDTRGGVGASPVRRADRGDRSAEKAAA